MPSKSMLSRLSQRRITSPGRPAKRAKPFRMPCGSLPDIEVYQHKCDVCDSVFPKAKLLRSHSHHYHKEATRTQPSEPRRLPAGKTMPGSRPTTDPTTHGDTVVMHTPDPETWEELDTPSYLGGVDNNMLLNDSFDWDEPFRGLGDNEKQLDDPVGEEESPVETTASPRAETPEPWTSPTNAPSSPAAALRGLRDQIDESMTPVDSTTSRTPSHFIQRERAQLPDGTVYERETISFYNPQPSKVYKSCGVQTVTELY